MPDVVDKATRSRMMSGIRGKNTRPERIIRSGLHRVGFRFRLHARDLPGKPDLVLPKYRAVIFINGCFWHGHDCHLFKWPETRQKFWKKKITRNVEVDSEVAADLHTLSWRQAVIWECALKGKSRRPLADILATAATWLRSGRRHLEIRGR